KKLGVDVSRVRPSGADGVDTMADVKAAAADGSARVGDAPARDTQRREAPAAPREAATSAPTPPATPATDRARSTVSAAGRPMRTSPSGDTPRTGQPEPLRGVRRNMARIMAEAHAQV